MTYLCLRQGKIKKEGQEEKEAVGLSVLEQSCAKPAQRDQAEPVMSRPALTLCPALFH